jgi:hypothetical protein
MTQVRMVNSVGDYVAGQDYELDEDTADRFITLGWAEGELSREISTEEQEQMRGEEQQVGLGPQPVQEPPEEE